MPRKKIVMLGVSQSFFKQSIRSFSRYEPLRDAQVVAVDIHREILDDGVAAAVKLNDELGMRLTITGTTKRKSALENADWVITAAETKRFDTWKNDLEIAARHGVGQAAGENGGPGGLLHALRQLTIYREFASDISEVCPDARIANLSNPMSHLCMLMVNHFGLDAYGICHGVQGCTGCCAEALGMDPNALDVVAVGLNHFLWLLEIRRRDTGEDFYPEFRKRIRNNIFHNRLSIDCMDIFGLYPVPYDNHIAEFLTFAVLECLVDYGKYLKLTPFAV